jgi:phosphate transport system substrate-binding protein
VTNRLHERASIWAAVVVTGLALAGCGGGGDQPESGAEGGGGAEEVSGAVVIDGSSTVEPLSSAAAELFMGENPGANVTVGTSGTGGGFEKFCAGETDISDASREIKQEEADKCKANGIEFTQLTVANDAISVVVNPQNNWATCLTVEQLKAMWEPNSQMKTWNQVDPAFPNEPLQLFGPGSDSGTFDYFTDAINGEEGASRTDYQASEDDNVIIQGVAGSKGALGYFGYTYLEENTDKLKGLEVNSGGGCVAPSAATAQDGTYTPLSRELFIYVSNKGLEKPQVAKFVEFYLANDDKIIEAAKFIGLTEEQSKKAQEDLNALKAKG